MSLVREGPTYMSPFKIRSGAQSVTGDHRENNEDRVYSDPALGLFLVADGMKGLSGGVQASQLAIDFLSDLVNEEAMSAWSTRDEICEMIRVSLFKTNELILDKRLRQPSRMGTTIALLLFRGNSGYVAGLGDSRAYFVRGNRLKQLTTDHTLAQALLDAGKISAKEMPKHALRRTLWKYLGSDDIRSSSGIEASMTDTVPGDRFQLASDGLTGDVSEAQIARLLQEAPHPQEAADLLVREALCNDSHDNISCVAVYLD
jgi:serine/threonine protein phosphatase PrpC